MITFFSFSEKSRFPGKISGKSPSIGYAIEGPIIMKKPRFTHDLSRFIAYRLSSILRAKKKSNTKTNLLKILTRGIPVKIIYLFYISFIYIYLNINTLNSYLFHHQLLLTTMMEIGRLTTTLLFTLV